MSTPEGKAQLGRYFKTTDGPAFSSEAYNRNASGPFAENFRKLIPDVEGRDALDFAKVKESWSAELRRVGDHFAFDPEQQGQAAKELVEREKVAAAWFDDPENREKIKKYLDDLDASAREAARPGKMSFEEERLADVRKSLEKDRRALIAPIDSWSKALRDSWVGLAKPEQRASAGEYAPALTDVKRADYATMIGLSACGLLLILGLFTPVAALGGATFLMLFYLSMPPFPGLPEPANSEGHYVFVNKNLIEFIACLALAATPSGLWLGVDALLFGWIDRVRYRRELRREEQAEAPRAGHVTIDIPRKSKTR